MPVCPSALDVVAEEQKGAEQPWHSLSLPVPAPLARAFEEQRSGVLVHSVFVGNLEVPLARTRLVGCFGACCQVLENCPNLRFLQALSSAGGGGGNSCIKMETHPFCQAINSASYGNREVPAFTLCFCTELASLFLCPDLAKHLSLNIALRVS